MRQMEYKVDCGTRSCYLFFKGVNFIRGRLIKNNSKLVCVDTLCAQGSRHIITMGILYNANRSRWESFADACINLNSLENFRGVLASLNYKRMFSALHVHNCNMFVSRSQAWSFYVC